MEGQTVHAPTLWREVERINLNCEFAFIRKYFQSYQKIKEKRLLIENTMDEQKNIFKGGYYE